MRKKSSAKDESTAKHRHRAWKSRRTHQQQEADIGAPPDIVNPGRREECKKDLKAHLLTYHSSHFPLKFSKHHLQFIQDAQEIGIDGGKEIFVFPRGSGKSTILLFAVTWVALHGHRRFPFLAPGDGEAAPEMLRAIQDELSTNELLLEDFPEVCYPFCMCDGIANRANYQTSRLEPTYIKLGKFIRFPSMPENEARGNSGTIIKAKGFLGAVRGKVVHFRGETVRPDLYLVDDPQTLKSAYSEIETRKRSKIIRADLLRGVGPGKTAAVFGAATIIRRDDLVHSMTNPKLFPGWKVIKVSLLCKWPANMDLWRKYSEMRLQAIENERPPLESHNFYLENRQAMDEGAEVYWPDRVDGGACSAIQSAMDRWIDDPETFASEDQNEPLDDELDTSEESIQVTHDELLESISHIKRGVVPATADKLVAFIDLSAKALWYAVCSFSVNFEIHVVDVGVWPENGTYTTLSTIRTTLRQQYGGSLDESIRKGCEQLIGFLTTRDWQTEHGESIPLSGGMVDSKWGAKMRLVRETVWRGDFPNIWLPYEGVGIGATNRALNDTTKPPQPREVRGMHWRKTPEKGGARVIADSNYWKSYLCQTIKDRRFSVYAGDVFSHKMLFEHLLAEYPVRVESKDRKVDIFKKRASHRDEHLSDCVYGCCVLASIHGIVGIGQEKAPERKPRRRLRQVDYDQQR